LSLAHIERILADPDRQRIHHPLGGKHALRPAEAAKRGVGAGVGLQRPGMDQRIGIEIAGIGVKHRPVDHAEREVRRIPATGVKQHFGRADASVRVMSERPVGAEVMPLAGHDHVVVAVEAQLAGMARHAGRKGRKGRPVVRLALLAAKPAAHAPHFHGHRRIRHRQHARDDVLGFARMLRRGVDENVAVLAGNRKRHLPFQIEMLLPADFHLAAQLGLRGGKTGFRRPLAELIVRQDRLVSGQRVVDGQHRRQRICNDPCFPRRPARRIAGRRDHREDRLPPIEDLAFYKHRLVAERRRDVVLSRNIRMGQHSDDAGALPHRLQVHLSDGASYNVICPSRHHMQRAGGLANVVDIGRTTADMLDRAVMRCRLAHASERAVVTGQKPGTTGRILKRHETSPRAGRP
jgi:hypothetical protein